MLDNDRFNKWFNAFILAGMTLVMIVMTLLELRDALGTTFVIVSHELASIFAIASNGIYLDVRTRRVTARGNPSELVRDPHTELQALRFLTRGEAGGPQQQD